MIDEGGNEGLGDVCPYPLLSLETVEQAKQQFLQKKQLIEKMPWTFPTLFRQLEELQLFPSLEFGLESALLSIFKPLSPFKVPVCALLMGSMEEIFDQAHQREREGYKHAKVKVGSLSLSKAYQVLDVLKNRFSLRVDVNRAWKKDEATTFFSKFQQDSFDYVEEPFQDPYDLKYFSHPVAVDESYRSGLPLSKVENLKAIIYKPTLQGGLRNALFVLNVAKKRGVKMILSSCFESDIGIAQIACLSRRLDLESPLGIGTLHYLKKQLSEMALKGPIASIQPTKISSLHL
jgi:O-succinylbenzoate synthase